MATVKYLDENGLSTVWSKVKGIVTPKADKVSGATNGHLAGLNSSGNLTDSGLPASNIAQKDGSYSGMTVGAAEDLVSAESVASEFTSRITGGSTAVGKGGTALVDKIKGRTLVWNQRVKNGNFETTLEWTPKTGVTFTVDNNTATVTSSASGDYYVNQSTPFVVGHKYMFSCDYNAGYTYGNVVFCYYGSGNDYFALQTSTSGVWRHEVRFFTCAANTYNLVRMQCGVANATNYYRNIQIFDLTLMYGSGNEPSTAAEFEALYPGPYYDYNPGELINNGHQTEYDLVWNQQLKTSSANRTTNGITVSYDSTTKRYHFTGTATATGSGPTICFTENTFPVGNKVILRVRKVSGTINSNSAYFFDQYAAARLPISMNGGDDLLTIGSGGFSIPQPMSFTVGDTIDAYYYISEYDLTLMFGAGNEPATAEEFEALFPDDYYTYDTGTQGHYSFPQFKTKIETVGWNIWDEEWETGSINENGVPTTSSGIVRSKNFCHMMPNTVYKGIADGRSDYLVVYFYDGNYNFIPYTGVDAYANGYNGTKTFTSPAGTAYFKFRTSPVYGGTYKNDICVGLSDPSRNGTYEPHWRSELELGLGDIKVKSHNLWDEEWEAGGIDATTGQNDSTSNIIRAKNYTPVTGGQSYYIYMGSASVSQAISMRYYDANKNLLGITDKNGSSNGANGVRVMPDNCAYIRFVTSGYYGSSTTYLNDTCINLSDPAYNGRYEPYGDGGVISITGGLKSAGTVYDEISGNKFVKRIESVDLGTKSWVYDSSGAYFYSDAPQGIKSVSLSSKGNVLCAKYGTVDGSSQSSTDKTVSIGYKYVSNGINIRDSSYTDAATFKAAVAGVPLYYELAQPIEYELAEAIPTAMRNDPYGTERRLPEDTAAIVTAPFRADITYSTNIKEAVQSLPQNYINVNSMQDFLAALGAQMGGTWTMRPADGKFDFTFTPNPVEPTL